MRQKLINITIIQEAEKENKLSRTVTDHINKYH